MSPDIYRKARVVIDIYYVVAIPLAQGIVTNYVVGIVALIMGAAVTLLRRRFLDEQAEILVLGDFPATGPRGRRAGEKVSSRADGRSIRVMALAALAATCLERRG